MFHTEFDNFLNLTIGNVWSVNKLIGIFNIIEAISVFLKTFVRLVMSQIMDETLCYYIVIILFSDCLAFIFSETTSLFRLIIVYVERQNTSFKDKN